MTKTSRERFQLTLEHQDPGKAVLDLGSTPITGINANALARLRTALGLEERKVKIEDPLQLLGQVDEDPLRLLQQRLEAVDHAVWSGGSSAAGF